MNKIINKTIFIILSLITLADNFAMQNNDSFTDIPSDIKKEIINFLLQSNSLQDATSRIKLMLANKDLSNLINQPATTQNLIKSLAKEFNVNELTAAAFLGTKTAQELFTKSLGSILGRSIPTKYLIQSVMAESLRHFSNTPQSINLIRLLVRKGAPDSLNQDYAKLSAQEILEAKGDSITCYDQNKKICESFGKKGKMVGDVFVNNNNGKIYIHSILIQPDGKILVGGSYNLYGFIGRLNPNGSIDHSFNLINNMKITNYFGEVNAIVTQSDDKIIIGGRHGNDGFMRQYKNNGSLIKAIEFTLRTVKRIATLPDDSIIILSRTQDFDKLILNRYTKDLELDTQFGTDGYIYINLK